MSKYKKNAELFKNLLLELDRRKSLSVPITTQNIHLLAELWLNKRLNPILIWPDSILQALYNNLYFNIMMVDKGY